MKIGYFDAVLSDAGAPLLATVTVYLADTLTKSTIYANKEGTIEKDNPFQTDFLGRFQFFATPGLYDIEVSGTGITTYKIEDAFLAPPADFWDVRDYASFSAAIDAIGSIEATLLIPNEQAVIANKTVPSNVTLLFIQGGSLNIAAEVTVTINGHIEAGFYQIFKGSGKVVFGTEALRFFKAQWSSGTVTDKIGIGTQPSETLDVAGKISGNMELFLRAMYEDHPLGGGDLALVAASFGGQAYIISNWYYGGDPADDRYARNSASGLIIFVLEDSPTEGLKAGDIAFLTAPSGTAGQPITWTQKMIIRSGYGVEFNRGVLLKTGGNKILEWTGPNTYNVFTSSGPNITSAIDSTGLTESAYSGPFDFGTLEAGRVYKLTVNLTLNSGQGPLLRSATPGNVDVTTFGWLVNGINRFIFVAVGTENKIYFLNSLAANWSATVTMTEIPLATQGDGYISGLPIYTNNAAAIAGGLVAGCLYRTGGDPDTVCVVH